MRTIMEGINTKNPEGKFSIMMSSATHDLMHDLQAEQINTEQNEDI